MGFYIVIYMLLFVIFIYMCIRIENRELYDDRLINTYLYECAHKCKIINNCHGFAYNNKYNICYPSQHIIGLDKSTYIYGDAISENNIICNKMVPIIDATDNPSVSDRKKNAVYVCKEKHNYQPTLYYENEGKLTKIDTGQNIDYLLNVDNYKITEYDWPKGSIEKNNKNIIVIEKNKINNYQYTISDLSKYLTNEKSNSKSKRELIDPLNKEYKIIDVNVFH